MQPAFEDDLLASAMVALAHHMYPPATRDRVARDALAVMARPAETYQEELDRLALLQTVMGFGPLARPEGEA